MEKPLRIEKLDFKEEQFYNNSMKASDFIRNLVLLQEDDFDVLTDRAGRWDYPSDYHRMRKDQKGELLRTALSNAKLARTICDCLIDKTSLSKEEWVLVCHISTHPTNCYGEDTDVVQEAMINTLHCIKQIPDEAREELRQANIPNPYLKQSFDRAIIKLRHLRKS